MSRASLEDLEVAVACAVCSRPTRLLLCARSRAYRSLLAARLALLRAGDAIVVRDGRAARPAQRDAPRRHSATRVDGRSRWRALKVVRGPSKRRTLNLTPQLSHRAVSRSSYLGDAAPSRDTDDHHPSKGDYYDRSLPNAARAKTAAARKLVALAAKGRERDDEPERCRWRPRRAA